MTILAALNGYHGRMADRGEVAPNGYSMERIGLALVLSPEGDVLDVLDLRDGKATPWTAAPRSSKRSGRTPRPFFLWDNTKHVLGLAYDKAAKAPVGTPVHAEAFREYHRQVIGDTDDAGLRAVLGFIDRWEPAMFAAPRFRPDMLDANVAFMLDGDDADGRPRFVHDRPAAREAWQAVVMGSRGDMGTCLVTGREAPIARLHPAIKGVMGAQSTGASIVSFNGDAFASYGAEQGLNSPVSEAVAEGYGAALNAMLRRDSGHALLIGDATAVFWCDASGVGEASADAAESMFGDMMDCVERTRADDGTEAAKLRDDVARLAAGEDIAGVRPDIDPATRTYILGLSPNVSRLYPRFWYRDTFGDLLANVRLHWEDMRIDPAPTRAGHLVPTWRLARETAVQGKADRVAPNLAGDLVRAVLTGGRYPKTLLASVITRLRADRNVNGVRAAICRACLQRDHRNGYEREEVPVSLDRDDPNPAYRLGRLFAMLEHAQYRALGGKVNAPVRDKFFASASSMPARVFPVLLNGAQNHVSKIRKESGAAAAERIDRDIAQALEVFGSGLPRTMGIEDQGRFVVGYYHQRNAYVARNGAAGTNGANGHPPPAAASTEADIQTET